MKKNLLLFFAVSLFSLTKTFAGVTVCLTNSYGEQTTLSVNGYSGGQFILSGSIDYTPYGGTAWPVTGTYTVATHTLNYTATNPSPDDCYQWASTVVFTYKVNRSSITGGFYNDCGVSGDLAAAANLGACAGGPPTLQQGENGGTGSHKMQRTQLMLPKGQNLEDMLKQTSISVTPNPVSKVANISITLPASTKITLNIYNKQGTLVHVIANDIVSAGKHNYTWNLQTKNGSAKADYYTVKMTTKGGEEYSTRILVAP